MGIERLRVVIVEFRALLVGQVVMRFIVEIVAQSRFTNVLLPEPVPPATPMIVTFIVVG